MSILTRLIINTLVVLAVAYVVPSVHVDGFMAAFVVALAIGVVNAILKPVLIFLTLPIEIVTLGLFTLVINAFLVMLVAYIVPGFSIGGFWSALIFGIIFSIVQIAFHRWERKQEF
ncbi:hypothetical protein A3I27_03575 [Candidatus Giovannonibacteria bacterium RIFCSPLOWO2_02_FULL_43_11b]|uniref:Phage holin family protein n=1 Tax=Candidatus Giovannonibacteria bacterium RIFCSPHIGHO2_12_FULL_43_15 TaxID=1798341 RepID=A0A1F5WQ30_9BACT|nr:MAG: hypothetical protein A3F23_01570 [Candidatus Giovannonibacteria bacterium RIFCSPHIGHO2_12_FULL_43_15]OGF89334.1 MAG: hypothetical protein A3I27_03575 [Candidatus Giovannonibacteria bacterium RIFCSPLOWO2_02_FULL_43_11b]